MCATGKYIKHRIEPALKFYRDRLPRKSRQVYLMIFVQLLLTAAAAFFSRYQEASLVVVVTGTASSLVSWTEYSDSQRKLVRYGHVVRSLKKLLSWWNHLSEVERSNTATIAHLVLTSEQIINDEHTAWVSTANKQTGGQQQQGDGAANARETSDGVAGSNPNGGNRGRVVPTTGAG